MDKEKQREKEGSRVWLGVSGREGEWRGERRGRQVCGGKETVRGVR